MKRSTGLRSDPEKTFAWRRRSRKPLPAMSRHRKQESRERAAVVAAVKLRDGFRCQARTAFPGVACRLPLDVHEIIPRSAWAGGYLVESNAITVCRGHHEHITEHPAEAHALGLHGYSWERPGRFPYPGSRP